MISAIEPARSDDIEPLCDLFLTLFDHMAEGRPDLFDCPAPGDPRARQRLRTYIHDRVERPDQTILVARQDDPVVGFVHVLVEDIPASPTIPFRRGCREAWLYHIAVAEGYRGVGLGSALEAAAWDWARQNGAETMGLQVWHFNSGAERFFAGLGYRPRTQRLYRAP